MMKRQFFTKVWCLHCCYYYYYYLLAFQCFFCVHECEGFLIPSSSRLNDRVALDLLNQCPWKRTAPPPTTIYKAMKMTSNDDDYDKDEIEEEEDYGTKAFDSICSKTKPGRIPGGGDSGRGDRELGGYDPSERIGGGINVGDPQIKVKEKERSVTSILKELAAIQQQGPQKYCILGTRHCSFLHQQIIELLAYALVLSGNHVYTSGAGGTHAATIRGALRAERPDLLTVVLPQSMRRQPKESQELLRDVDDVIAMPQNDEMPLDLASRICNSYLLSQTDKLISFAFHESTTVIEATKEAKKLDMLVTVLYLD